MKYNIMRVFIFLMIVSWLLGCVYTPNIKETPYDFEKVRANQWTNQLSIYSTDVQLISRVSQNIFSNLNTNSILLVFIDPNKPPRKMFYDINNYQFKELLIKYKIEDEIVFGALLAIPAGGLSSYFSERLVLSFYSQNDDMILVNNNKFEIQIWKHSEMQIFSELAKQSELSKPLNK
ncbi:MAG: hypothetical protein HQ562_09210 [Candidatus Marinimicrobia bacterium]|nr:hypothetical protein [Candidatus Neomarinimicrobiota bacterium]